MDYRKLDLRPWQDEHRNAARIKLLEGKKVLVSAPFCGSGKTLATLVSANDAYRAGKIGGLLVLVPRVNLAEQYELDWNELRPKLQSPTMGKVCYRKNDLPLLIPDSGQFGVVATYAQFVSKPHYFFDYVSRNNAGIVLDEGQILGHDEFSGEGTRAAALLKNGCSHKNEYFGDGHHDQYGPILQYSPFLQITTGTPNRSDGKKLLFGRYSQPDISGNFFLQPDVYASYLTGVRDGYLRGFEAHLCDGRAWKQYVDSDPESLVLSKMNRGTSSIILHPDFWQKAVDLGVEQTRDVQLKDRRYCGLYAAYDQKQAKRIMEYLQKRHRGFRVGIAISEENGSRDELKRFRNGEYDAVVTVLMAYIGFNHPWIRVITCLSAYRETGFLDQLSGRGLRIVREHPIDDQNLRWIAPHDRLMDKWVEDKESDSVQGLRLKDQDGPGRQPPPPGDPGIISDVRMTDISARGLELVLTPEHYAYVEDLKRAAGLGGYDLTSLARFLILSGKDPSSMVRDGHHPDRSSPGNPPPNRHPDPAPQQPPPGPAFPPDDFPPDMTDEQWRDKLKSRIKEFANKCDFLLMKADPSIQHGRTYQEIHDVFSIASVPAQGREKLAQILTWVQSEWLPYCERLGRLAT